MQLPCDEAEVMLDSFISCWSAGYLLIPITGVILSGSNLIGYLKCSKDAKKQLQSMAANMATSAMTSAVTGRIQAAIARV
jgi:hypothetical protein